MAGLDLDQLQAELELKRSALADSILSKLPGLGGPSSSPAESAAAQHGTGRPRQANLGVGATPKSADGSDLTPNGKPRSAADLRLKGALTAKRKRWQDDEPNPLKRDGETEEEQDDEVSRADAINAKKKVKQANHATATAAANGKAAKKDPFAAKGIEAQKAAQNQPRIIIVDGEEVDLSKLSKTQRKKINKQLKAQQGSNDNDDEEQSVATPLKSQTSTSTASTPVAAAIASTSTPSKAAQGSAGGGGALTALQAQMLSKLSGSRFRTINEKLYTTASTEAVSMIDAAPAMFDEYHQGFREQVRSWPKNPLDIIVDLFDPSISSAGGKAKAKGKNKGETTPGNVAGGKARFTPGALVVDLGAGEGGLAKKLVPKGVKVLCYDLVTTGDGWVRKQDTAQIGGLALPGYFNSADPLGLQAPPKDASPGIADVAVFCLSLMGTNWIHMILEAKRVLRTGGELIVAEVSSRFYGGFDAFIEVVKMAGFGLAKKDASNTHFVLFEFWKLEQKDHVAYVNKTGGEVGGSIDAKNATLDELAAYGKTLLKPCIYKRR